MALPVRQAQTVQFLRTGEIFARFEPTADVATADAKLSLYTVPQPAPGLYWPLWQMSYYFSAGTAKTANLRIHARDLNGEWHALSLVALIHDDATTDSNSQVMQFEAPPAHDAIALEIDLTNADERPHIIFRPACWATMPLDGVNA